MSALRWKPQRLASPTKWKQPKPVSDLRRQSQRLVRPLRKHPRVSAPGAETVKVRSPDVKRTEVSAPDVKQTAIRTGEVLGAAPDAGFGAAALPG